MKAIDRSECSPLHYAKVYKRVASFLEKKGVNMMDTKPTMENSDFMKRRQMVVDEIRSLESKPLAELRKIWKDLFQSDAPPYSKKSLIKRVAYRLQEIACGSMSGEGKKSLLTFVINWSKGRSME